MERDGAREATRAAREAYQQCRTAYEERAAPVKELQQQRADAASSATKLRESFRWVLLGAVGCGQQCFAGDSPSGWRFFKSMLRACCVR